MPEESLTNKIALDDIMETAAAGALRALAARDLIGPGFTDRNGFLITINITAGGYPKDAGLSNLGPPNVITSGGGQ